MAVSIDTVYQRVLAIANKEQRGYITPQEFNLFANQAQLKIFENYFYELDKFLRLPGNDSAYSDRINILEEKIAYFEKNKVAMSLVDGDSYLAEEVTNGDFTAFSGFDDTSFELGVIQFSADPETTLASGALTLPGKAVSGTRVELTNGTTQFFGLDTGRFYNLTYTITTAGTTDLRYSNNDSSVFTSLPATVGSHTVIVEAKGDRVFIRNADTTVANTVVFSSISIKEVVQDTATLPTDTYRLGTVFYNNGTKNIRNENITAKEADLMEQTALYKASELRPVYVRLSATRLRFYPANVSPVRSISNVNCNYVAKPTDVSWGYNITLGEATYNSATSTDFELHPSEENSLVFEILELAGIMMSDVGLINVADKEEASKNQQELM
jgi:hypothetical protein